MMTISRTKLLQLREAVKLCRHEIEQSQHHHLHQASKPDFKPNPNLGEGSASKEEKDYRKEVLALLALLYTPISKIAKDSKLSLDEKIIKTNNLIETNAAKYGQVIVKNTKTIFDSAVTSANNDLKKIDKNLKKLAPSQGYLDRVQQQQRSNAMHILDALQGKIEMGLFMDEINDDLREDYEYNYAYVDDAFNESKNRLDGMGWYGWTKSNEAGLIGTFALGAAILGDLVADWVSMGDDKTCEDCFELEANSPYSVLSWPVEPHFGCRCGMKNIRLENI